MIRMRMRRERRMRRRKKGNLMILREVGRKAQVGRQLV